MSAEKTLYWPSLWAIWSGQFNTRKSRYR